MQKHYECVIIYTPVLADDQLKEAIADFKGVLKGKKAEIVHEENWGLRKLAYPISKKSTGFYFICEYKLAGAELADVELILKRDERVLRFLTVSLDKHAAEYSIKRISKAKTAKKATKTEEA